MKRIFTRLTALLLNEHKQCLRDNRLGGPVKPMSAPEGRPGEMGDVEWQLRNWYNYYWLSGDGLVEQAVHHVDRIMWVMKDLPPSHCLANGGRNIPNHEATSMTTSMHAGNGRMARRPPWRSGRSRVVTLTPPSR